MSDAPIHKVSQGTTRPSVLLWHEGEGIIPHVDWMFATDSDGKEPLMTFRIPRRLDELNAGESMEAESLGDHRPRYLHYEGPLSDNRGSVKRIATGQLRASHNEAGESEYEIHWDSGTAQGRVQRILLQKSPKGTLTLFCVS